MPISSMTGFGLAESAAPSGNYRVEIRGVNNRYQDVQIRLPKFAMNLEAKVKKELSAIISRGSISVFISCDRGEVSDVKLTWDKSVVDNYLRIFNEVKDEYGLAGEIRLADLLRYSDFIRSESVAYSEDALWKHMRPAVAAAVKAFQESREVEGAQLVKELRKILKDITKTLQQIEKRVPERVKEYSAALSARVDKLIAAQPDPQRIATEVAMMAERLDITEEITRLRAHIEKFSADFDSDEPVGKRMGFLLQEMNREANTIGSKANDTEIAHKAVVLKENIEKIREQIQNIE
ncbi:MAG: YicC family protein [Chitinispirillia bacterium]|nr:YicC family protein [Chitinispirillia bacterium]MCL2240974.1 YicC family protein [Chitinispirillia bacterium]